MYVGYQHWNNGTNCF